MEKFSIKQAFLAELEREAAVTRKTLERVPEDKFGWRPHPKSTTLGQLTIHIATLPRFIALATKEDTTEAGSHRPPEIPKNRNEIIAAFEKSLQEAENAIKNTNEENFTKIWKLTFQGKTIMELPKHAAIQIVGLNHLIHHRAQLGVYLRLNNIAVPSSYGPSADEQI